MLFQPQTVETVQVHLHRVFCNICVQQRISLDLVEEVSQVTHRLHGLVALRDYRPDYWVIVQSNVFACLVHRAHPICVDAGLDQFFGQDSLELSELLGVIERVRLLLEALNGLVGCRM